MLCTSFHVSRQSDDLVRRAGAVEVERLANELRGQRPTDAFLRRVTSLGADLDEQDLPGVADVDVPPILMPYEV
ncbi:MAG: hypothetical protein ACF8PG_06925 [Maioricimonas sp. JB045]